MKIRFLHCNINVLDLEKSVSFYEKALSLKEIRRNDQKNFTIVFMGDGASDFNLELTFLKDRSEPYDLGDNESHVAFEAEDFDAVHKLHEEMGCICFENPDMGIYFIEDPDGYWMEIIPPRRGR
ncbi:MAG: VOC family protein [Synergistaceae bacterium]|jgi:lactoylglutathione lyase|nr:VOC family protein [Synergistaceae bacterium]